MTNVRSSELRRGDVLVDERFDGSRSCDPVRRVVRSDDGGVVAILDETEVDGGRVCVATDAEIAAAREAAS